MRKGIVLVMCVGVLVAGIGAAYGDTIYACVHNTNGKVRIVQTPGTCLQTEYELNWGEGDDLEQVVNSLLGRVDALEGALGIINEAPTVDCGDDISVLLDQQVILSASYDDDGLFEPLAFQWSKHSGPGDVTFANSTEPITETYFTDAGEYEVELAVNDGLVVVTDRITVNVFQQNVPPQISILNDFDCATTNEFLGYEVRISCSMSGTLQVMDDGVPGPLSWELEVPTSYYEEITWYPSGSLANMGFEMFPSLIPTATIQSDGSTVIDIDVHFIYWSMSSPFPPVEWVSFPLDVTVTDGWETTVQRIDLICTTNLSSP